MVIENIIHTDWSVIGLVIVPIVAIIGILIFNYYQNRVQRRQIKDEWWEKKRYGAYRYVLKWRIIELSNLINIYLTIFNYQKEIENDGEDRNDDEDEREKIFHNKYMENIGHCISDREKYHKEYDEYFLNFIMQIDNPNVLLKLFEIESLTKDFLIMINPEISSSDKEGNFSAQFTISDETQKLLFKIIQEILGFYSLIRRQLDLSELEEESIDYILVTKLKNQKEDTTDDVLSY